MRWKHEYVKFKNYERKLKSQFIICADFESILITEVNHVTCIYGYKLVCVDDKFSKPYHIATLIILNHIYVKMSFTISLKVWSKKVSTVFIVPISKNILTKNL